MNRFLLLFPCSLSVLLFGCSTQASQSSQLIVPHSDLSGPVPPGIPASSSRQENIDKALFERDPKKACLTILENSLSSKNYQVVLSSLFSYGLLQIPLPDQIVPKFLDDQNPFLLLQLLMTLYEAQSPDALWASQRAMMSDYPMIQLYAARYLAMKKTQDSLTRIESLESKLPEEFLPYIVELYGLEGSLQAEGRIKKLLYSSKSDTIAQCLGVIRFCSLMGLYPELFIINPTNAQEAEALAFALGSQRTTAARSRLEQLAHHSNPAVAIQALVSMNSLEEKYSLETYRSLISTQSPFVFSLLHKTAFSTEELESLWSYDLEWSARFGLAYALLERRSPIGLPFLFQTLYESDQSLYLRTYSLAGTVSAITKESRCCSPSMEEQAKLYESQSLVESLIHSLAQYFPNEFEQFAEQALLKAPTSLAPVLISALTDTSTQTNTNLLHKLSITPGQPFIRTLALFSLIQQHEAPLDPATIQPILKRMRETLKQLLHPKSLFSLFHEGPKESEMNTLNEQQRLYFAAIGVLAQAKNEASVTILTQELQEASEEYRPLVAAALLHSLL